MDSLLVTTGSPGTGIIVLPPYLPGALYTLAGGTLDTQDTIVGQGSFGGWLVAIAVNRSFTRSIW